MPRRSLTAPGNACSVDPTAARVRAAEPRPDLGRRTGRRFEERVAVVPNLRHVPRDDGGRQHRRLLRRQFELAGIRPATFHTLRHSAAKLLLVQGVPSPVILDVLGHHGLRVRRRYQHDTDSLRLAPPGRSGRHSQELRCQVQLSKSRPPNEFGVLQGWGVEDSNL